VADEPKIIIKEVEPGNTLMLELPIGFSRGQGWEAGTSYHMEQTPRGFALVRDERPV
jgi:hypothetical protein